MLPKFGLLLLGALLSIAICSHAAIVFNDPTLVAEKFNGQALFDYVVPFYPLGFEGPFPESITAELVPSTAANLTGKIVLMPVVLPYSTFLPGLQQAGAVACLVQTVFALPGQASFIGNNYDAAGSTLPTLDMASTVYATIAPVIESVGSTSVTIYFNETNVWYTTFTDPANTFPPQLIILAFSFTIIVIAAVQLGRFIYRDRALRVRIPQCILIIEIAGNLVRIAYFINLSGVRGLYGYVAYFFLSSSTTPFTITSALLITFYWHETMTRCSLELTATLGKTRVPFIVAMVLNFVLLYAVTAVALFFSTIQVIILIYYVLLAVSVAIFYLVISSKVIKALRRIRESRKLSKRQNRRLDRTQQATFRMIAIGVLLLAFTVFTIVGGFVISTPVAQISFLPAAYCITMAISLVLVLSFDPKTVSSSSTGSSNTSFSRANSQRMSRTNSQVNSFKNVEAREVKAADAVDPKHLAEKLDEVKESPDSSGSSSESSDESKSESSPSSKQQLKQVQADDDEESSDEGSDVESQSN
jgi:hypothetical protein